MLSTIWILRNAQKLFAYADFRKKGTKDYKKTIKQAEKILENYLKEKVIMGKSINAKGLIAKRYGKEGSKEREEFRENAFSYYFGEIIKNRRKELQMSQENLAEKVGKKRPYISRNENKEDIRLSNFALLANDIGLWIKLKAE